MTWLENQIAQYGAAFEEDIQRYMQSAGLYQSVHQLCGPFGVRRFIIRFQKKGTDIHIQALESIPLQYGGGAPPQQTREKIDEIKRSLQRLYNNMSGGPKWQSGCMGVIRDLDNNLQIVPFFDGDAEDISVEMLPLPAQGHPLEGPEYLQLKASLAAQLEPIMHNTQAIAHDWDFWEINDDTLSLVYMDETGQHIENKRCLVLSTYTQGEWAWQVNEPLFEQEIFCWEYFISDWDSAMELGLVSAARLNASWLFYSVVDEQNQSMLFVVVWD